MNESVELSTANSPLSRQYLYYKILPHFTEPIYVLDEYLKQNTHLFTLVGVFAALTIYLETVSGHLGGTEFIDYALFIGFSIVTLLSFLVLAKAGPYFYNSAGVTRSTENWGLILFIIFYLQIIALVIGVIVQFEEILTLYIAVAVLILAEFAGLGLSLGGATLLSNVSKRFDRIAYPVFTIGIVLMLIVGSVALIRAPPIPNVGEIDGLITLAQIYSITYNITFAIYFLLIGLLTGFTALYFPAWVWDQRDIILGLLKR